MSRITYLSRYHTNACCTVDDGTGTIDCAIRISEEEDKPETKRNDRDRPRDVRSSARERTDGLASTSVRPDPIIIPVGSVVNVQGKIRVKYNSRELHGDTIGLYSTLSLDVPERILLNNSVVRCRGLGEELKHWQRVTALHKNYYFLPERFVIPPSSGTNAVNAQDTPHTPHTPRSTKVIASVSSTPGAYLTASSSSSATSSPANSTDDTLVRSELLTPRAPDISDFYFSF